MLNLFTKHAFLFMKSEYFVDIRILRCAGSISLTNWFSIVYGLCIVRYTVQWRQRCKNEHFQLLIKRKTEWNCILQAGKSRETSSVHQSVTLTAEYETLAASPWSALTLQLNTQRRVCVLSRPLSISIRFINRLCLQTTKTWIQHTWHTPMLVWLSRHTLYLCLSRMTHWSKREEVFLTPEHTSFWGRLRDLLRQRECEKAELACDL